MSNFDDNSFDLKSEFHSDVFTSSPNNTLILKKSADKDNVTFICLILSGTLKKINF